MTLDQFIKIMDGLPFSPTRDTGGKLKLELARQYMQALKIKETV